MSRQKIGRIYLMLSTLTTYMNFCEPTTTSILKDELVSASHHRHPNDPIMLSVLDEIFGKEDITEPHGNKRSVATSENIVDVSKPRLLKTSSPVKGGNLPLVDFKGVGNGTLNLIDQRYEMNNCLRLVRQTQAKLKYFWNKVYRKKSTDGNGIVLAGTEKACPGSSHNLEVPLTLQLGEPSVKS